MIMVMKPQILFYVLSVSKDRLRTKNIHLFIKVSIDLLDVMIIRDDKFGILTERKCST